MRHLGSWAANGARRADDRGSRRRFVAARSLARIAIVSFLVALPTPTPAQGTDFSTSTSTGSVCNCEGDADKNNFVNFTDFRAVRVEFGAPADPETGMGDADCSGFVNFTDFGLVQSEFGAACP
jgi:hypothetical protein